MNLAYGLSQIARVVPHARAVTCEDRTITYAAFDAQVSAIAGALRHRHGLEPGDRVAMWMENGPEFLPVMFAAWRAGLVAVPVNNKLHPRELAWIIENCGARLLLATPALAASLSELGHGAVPLRVIVSGTRDFDALLGHEPLPECPTDPAAGAWLFYTSGTTGRPKGAMLSHRNLLFACHAYYADIDGVDHRDCFLHAAPLSHGSGLYGLAHILKGSHQIVHRGFDPLAILDAIAKHPNLSTFAAPTMIKRLIDHPGAAAADFENLKCITYGGAPMYVSDLKRALALMGPRLYQLYGQGEAPMTITGLTKAMHATVDHPRFEQRLASAGLARTGVAWKIVDEEGRDVPDGTVGEIVTRSDCVMVGYWNNPDANARALRDGWLWTGDMGARDEEGLLTIKDRSKDMIISGGSNIYPREIEEVLLTHPGVAECAVVSRPHAEWGEEVVAFVVRRQGGQGPVDEHGLDALCLANIARFKRPKSYRFVDVLPKNNYGKILKTDLRSALLGETAGEDGR